MQGAYDQQADQGEDAYFQLLRQMAQMPDTQLPEPAMPQFDLKGMLIGSALAGLVGGGEGANQFLQGTMAGKQYTQQQDNVRREQEFRKKKLAQDREYGILKTEAEIANAKANRAFQRSENFRRDAADVRRQKEMDARQAALRKEIALEGARNDLRGAKDVSEFDRAIGSLRDLGAPVDPKEAEALRKGIEAKQARAERLKYGMLTFRDDARTIDDSSKDAKARLSALQSMYDVGKYDPETFAMYTRVPPDKLEEWYSTMRNRIGYESSSERQRLNNAAAAASRGKASEASADLAKVRLSIQKIALKYADEKERKMLTEKGLRIEKLQREAKEADNVLSGLMNKPMTGSTYESARRAYLTKVQEATSNAALGETTLAMLKNKLKAKSFGTGEDASSVQHQIFLLEGTNELPGAIAIHKANAKQFQAEMDALTTRFSQSAQPAPQPGPQKGATRSYQGFTYVFDGKEWVKQK